MYKKVKIYTATKHNKENCLLYKSSNFNNIPIYFKENNVESLHKCYNSFIDDARKSNVDIAVILHDDVYINTKDLYDRLKEYADKFIVFGLAGSTACKINAPVLWHLMSEKNSHRGCVAHGNTDAYIYTSFGPVNCKALLIDGVFIGININYLPANVKFDENFPSRFHFYDLSFSLECAFNKIRVGVVDIPIIHQSPGLTNPDKEFYDGQEYFLEKYKNFKNKILTV